MPYKKPYKRNYRTYRPNRYNNRSAIVGLNKRINGVYRALKPETKHVFTSLGSQDIDDVAAWTSLHTVEQGSGSNQRIGEVVRMTGIWMRGHFFREANTPRDCMIRLVVLMDTRHDQPHGFGTTDVFSNTELISPLNPDNYGRFRILRNMRVLLTESRESRQWEFFIKLQDDIRYVNAAGTLVEGKALYYRLESNVPSINDPPKGAMEIKVSYTDA